MSKRNKKRNSKARFIRGTGQGTPSGVSKPWLPAMEDAVAQYDRSISRTHIYILEAYFEKFFPPYAVSDFYAPYVELTAMEALFGHDRLHASAASTVRPPVTHDGWTPVLCTGCGSLRERHVRRGALDGLIPRPHFYVSCLHNRRFRVECRMDGTSHSTELRTRGIGGVI